MIDEKDEENIGLIGRPSELQFVRLAGAHNQLKLKVEKLTALLKEIVQRNPNTCPLCGGDLRPPKDCTHCEIDHLGGDCYRKGHTQECTLSEVM